MFDAHQDLIDALQVNPDVLRGLLRTVTQEQAQAARGGDENWSVVEVVCHLRDAEERFLERMRAMRDEDNPIIEGYDQEAWARERNYAADDLRDALDAFIRLRALHVGELAALSPTDWERSGQHSEFGLITISGQTLHAAAHDAVHAAQLARQLTP